MTAYDGVIIDHGGVLTTPIATALVEAIEATDESTDEVLDAWGSDPAGQLALAELERGTTSLPDFLRAVASVHPVLGLVLDPGAEEFFGRHLTRAVEVWEALGAAHAEGVRVVLLSNTPRAWLAEMEPTVPPRHLFDAEVFSWRTGVRKPDPDAFRLAADAIGVDLSRMVLLDDSADAVASAEALGCNAVLVDRPACAADLLRSLIDDTPSSTEITEETR